MIPNSTAWLLLNAGIIKVNVTFYFYRVINSDTAFERHGSRIPIRDDLNTVQALKKHLVLFLGLKELSLKYGLRESSYATESGRKSDNFAVTLDEQWKLELPNTLDGTGSEMNSMCF